MCSGEPGDGTERTHGGALGHMSAIDSRIISAIQTRLKGIRGWMDEAAPYATADQRHLDSNTPERAYWHFGYQTALQDILTLAEQCSSPKHRSGDMSS
jgi:hypothetical protein